jgi:hypothetical protein
MWIGYAVKNMAVGVEYREGATVVCPKCGQPGVLKVDTFKAAGREYRYWVVRHGAKRCILQRFEEGAPAAAPTQQEQLPVGEALAESEREGEEAQAKAEAVEVAPKTESYPREFQRRAWYAAKVGSSVGALKENPTRENFERLKSTAAQVTERLGVPTADLIEAAERYLETKSEASKMKLNETLTLVVCRIFSSLSTVAEKRGGSAPPAAVAEAIESLEERLGNLEELIRGALSSQPEKREEVRLDAAAIAAAVAEELLKRLPRPTARAPAQPRRRGGLKGLIVEILSDGRERTRSEIESEIEKRTGMRPASGPVSGRLSELAKEGVIVKLKRENLWYWKIAGGGGLE